MACQSTGLSLQIYNKLPNKRKFKGKDHPVIMDVFLEEININQYSSNKHIMEGIALYCINIPFSFYRFIYLEIGRERGNNLRTLV